MDVLLRNVDYKNMAKFNIASESTPLKAKVERLKRQYTSMANQGYTTNEIAKAIDKENLKDRPYLSTQLVADLCHWGQYQWDEKVAEIVNGVG